MVTAPLFMTLLQAKPSVLIIPFLKVSLRGVKRESGAEPLRGWAPMEQEQELPPARGRDTEVGMGQEPGGPHPPPLESVLQASDAPSTVGRDLK